MTHFDVILPTIGRDSLKAAIQSVVDQTHKDFTLRIAYDGYVGWPGEDDPIGWQDIVKDTRYTVQGLGKTPRNDYGAYARNSQVNMDMYRLISPEKVFAMTGWVAYIDDDDEWLPHHLAKINQFIEDHPGIDMVRTSGQSFMMKHKSPRSSKLVRKLGPVNTTDILTVGMAHTREIFSKTQGWQPCDNHDHILWREMLAAGGKAVESDEITFHFCR